MSHAPHAPRHSRPEPATRRFLEISTKQNSRTDGSEARALTATKPWAYVSSLDGLRGLAIAGVLLFHTGHLDGGFLGVDLFFVLSGFLITGLLLRETSGTGSVSLRRFWARRLRRLFPALATMLAAVTLTVWWLERAAAGMAANGEMVRTTLSDGPWVQLHLINWHLLAQDAGYWDAFGQSRLFAHLWSIAVEEQFYIVWPAILLLTAAVIGSVIGVHRRRDPVVLGWAVILACGLLAVLSLTLMILLLEPADPTRVYTGTDTRAFSLLLGAAAATEPARLLFRHLLQLLGRAAGTVTALLTAGILTSWFLADGTDAAGLFTGGLFAHATASAVLIGLCAEHHARPERGREPLQAVLESAPLRWLGQISYSLYLWHWPVIVLMAPELPGLSGWAHTSVVLGISIALAAASKYLIEDPVRFRAGWARGTTGAVVFAMASAALLALWLLLPQPAGPQIDVTRI
ncbi:acyltransferase family protein [Phytoactinopolyspora halotolerans]|uniref:Acyltransferase n=1 Tax=Phytoactinopolyspora halotolerans TaxID=1981512 RepID=A0A6L9S5G3_9ACTN|nr:acyltransferase [Phytoactinopolyspora halotolerans]NEE00406.1 acyltransferase [Phytoactinopolyspora halotolerans]